MRFVDVSVLDPLNQFLQRLVTEFPEIEEIWLFGSRAERLPDAQDWDLMVRSLDRLTPERVAASAQFRSEEFALFIANGDEFRRPWPRAKDDVVEFGSFTGWKWAWESPDRATYEAHAEKLNRRSGRKPALPI